MAESSQSPFQAPACDVCGKDAVVEQAYSGRILCGYHLEKSIGILKIQLRFRFCKRVQAEAFNAGVVRIQHGRVIPESISSSGL